MTTNHPSVCQSKIREERGNVTGHDSRKSRDPDTVLPGLPALFDRAALRRTLRRGQALYTLMLDRASVSCENGYLEPDGSIRIYFTVEDVRQKLHKGKQRSVAVLRELEACGLIRRRKRGQGRQAVITLNYPDDVRFVERKGEAHDL